MAKQQRTRDAGAESVLDEQVPNNNNNSEARDERACHNCGQVGHIAKRCPRGGAGGGKGRGTRARGSANAVAKSAHEGAQEAQGAADASREVVADLRAQLAKLNAAPPIHALPDQKKLLFSRRIDLRGFQSDPQMTAAAFQWLWKKTAVWGLVLAFFSMLANFFLQTQPLAAAVISCGLLSIWHIVRYVRFVGAEVKAGLTVATSLAAACFVVCMMKPNLFFLVVALLSPYVLVALAFVVSKIQEVDEKTPYEGTRLKYIYNVSCHHEWDSDERGPTTRAQNMLYSDPCYSEWTVYNFTGRKHNEDDEDQFGRVIMVSEVLLQVLLSQTVALHVDTPKTVMEKMVLLAKSQSCINIALIDQATHGVVQNTIDVAFAALYGYKLGTATRMFHHVLRDPGNVAAPERF